MEILKFGKLRYFYFSHNWNGNEALLNRMAGMKVTWSDSYSDAQLSTKYTFGINFLFFKFKLCKYTFGNDCLILLISNSAS